MRLLQQLKLLPQTELVDDTAQQQAYALIKKVHAGDHEGAEALLCQASDESRERLVYGFTQSADSVAQAREWANRKPRATFAHVVLGAALIFEGWRIRGGSYADSVDEKDWGPFLQKLGEAKDALTRATDMDKQFADPYAWLIHAGVGSGEEPAQLKTWLDAALAREPLHWGAHYKYFMSTTQKWGGSHKDMFAFARASAIRGGKYSLLNVLLPMAYCEFALAETSRHNAKAAAIKLRHSRYAKELTLVLYQWVGGPPDRLEDLLLDMGGPFRGHALNHFGAALYLTGAKKEARIVFKALNGQIECVPWAWFSKGLKERMAPGFVFDRACREMGVPL